MLTAPAVLSLKRAIRTQLPAVKSTHLLEALARGFGFNTWVALNTALSRLAANESLAAGLSREAIVARLAKFGHPEAEIRMTLFAEVSMLAIMSPPTQSNATINSRIATATVTISTTLEDMEARGMISAEHGASIRELLARRSVILISGETGSGKSTMMRALMPGMAAHVSPQRIGLIQHVREFDHVPKNVSEIFLDQSSSARSYVTLAGEPPRMSDYGTFFVDEMSLLSPKTAASIFSTWKLSRVGLGTAHLLLPFVDESALEAVDAIIYMHSEGREIRVKDVKVLSKRPPAHSK
jgi:ABC-type glutathione transport system ATPase component